MAIKIVTDEKIEVDVNGTVYNVKVPSMKKIGELERDTKKLDPSELPDFYSTFFASLGLPVVASENFTLKNWKMLIEEVTGAKKP